MALRLTVARCVLLFHVTKMIADGGKSAKDNQDVPVMVGGTWNMSSQRQQMSNKIIDMTDDELVSHYRDMQCLSVDTSTKEGLDNLRYYQGIVRQMARRFAILVENREIEDEPE